MSSSKNNGFHSDLEASHRQKLRLANTKPKSSKQKGPYMLGETLGEGAFAKVKSAVHIQTNEKVAIKILDKEKTFQEEEDVIRVQKEIDILKKLKHKNIIQLYEIMESKKNLYIVMEYCEGKELFEYIVKKKKLAEQEACKFFQEIIDALEYLHENNITHRDLKPENLLLDYKKSIKISDFGLSTIKSSEKSLLGTPCGTPNYAPPEMLRGDEYNGLLSDVWSCGIILYAMLCGYLPFSESKEHIIYKKIIEHEYEYPSFLSASAVDLLQNILKVEPQERFDIKRIKQHPWFNLAQPTLRPGIIFGRICIPIDERILKKVESLGFDKSKCRLNLLNNKFDSLTTIYYLCLRKFIKEGGKSISDLNSSEYLNYIEKEMIKASADEEVKWEKNSEANRRSTALDKLNNADLSVDDIKRYQNRDNDEDYKSYVQNCIKKSDQNINSRKESKNENEILKSECDSNKLNETVVRLNNHMSEAKFNNGSIENTGSFSELKQNLNDKNLNNESDNNKNNDNQISFNKLPVNLFKSGNKKQYEKKTDRNGKRNSYSINQSFHHEIFNNESKENKSIRNETFNRTNSEVNQSLRNKKLNNEEDNYEKIIDIIAKINQNKNFKYAATTQESKLLTNQSLNNTSYFNIQSEIKDPKNIKSPSNNRINNKKDVVVKREFNSDKKRSINRSYVYNDEFNSLSEKRINTERINLSNKKETLKNLSKNILNADSNEKLIDNSFKDSRDHSRTKPEKEGIEEEEEAIITEINQKLCDENNSNKMSSNALFDLSNYDITKNSKAFKDMKLIKNEQEQHSNKKNKNENIKFKSYKYAAATERNKHADNNNNKSNPTTNTKKTNEENNTFKTNNENLNKQNASSKKSEIKERNNKTIDTILSNLDKNSKLNTPKNPSFLSQNENQSDFKINKITEKIFQNKHRNSVCIPDPNFTDKLGNVINLKDTGNYHTIREKLREYSSSFVDQPYKSNLNRLKDSSNRAALLKNSYNSKEKLKITKNKNESLTSSTLMKEKENILKEHIKDKEKEIKQNKINQQKNKMISLNTKTTVAQQNQATNSKNKNVFSPFTKEAKKPREAEYSNNNVEKVEINLEKKNYLNVNIKRPSNLDSRSANSEEKVKYTFNKNANSNTSSENFYSEINSKNANNNKNNKKDSISKSKNQNIKNNLFLKTDRFIYSSFQSGKNNELNRNEKIAKSPKSIENSSRKGNKINSAFDKNHYMTNNKNLTSAVNLLSETNEQKELNEYIDNKPTESNMEFEIEEYEELSKINPNMKVLEFIANKLVEKSKHLDSNLLEAKQKSNSTMNNKQTNANYSNQTSNAGSQSRKFSMESNNTFVIKNNENDFDNVINVLNSKYKNLIGLNAADKLSKNNFPHNFDFSSDEKISQIHNKETDSNQKKRNEYSKTFIEKTSNSIVNKDKKIYEITNNYNNTNINNNNKLLKKMPSKSKLDVKRKTNSRNRFSSNAKNKNLRFSKDKKFNRENLLINMKIAKQIFSKEKKPLNLNIKKTFLDESNKKTTKNNENQIKAIKDSINKVNITNNIFNKNALLDISATYDPELDSRGETSVDRSKSKSFARRSFSINNKNTDFFAVSPKGNNNNNLISINENYKDEVNESFNNCKIKKISFKENRDDKDKSRFDSKDLNIRIIENSSEVISNLKSNLSKDAKQQEQNKLVISKKNYLIFFQLKI